VQQGVGKAAQPETPAPNPVVGADDDHRGLAAVGIIDRLEQPLGDRIGMAQMAFRANLFGNVSQSVCQPLPALVLDFGVERVVRRVHVECRCGAGQHRDQVERRTRGTGQRRREIHPMKAAVAGPVTDDIAHSSRR
jgi:hypothetical protein